MPKAYQVPEVYIPDEPVEILRRIKPRPGCDLLFTTRDGTPNFKLLIGRRIGKRAGVNQDDFWLHKWRSTYATHCLRNGMDLATLRDPMGHKDLKNIERYLRHFNRTNVGTRASALLSWLLCEAACAGLGSILHRRKMYLGGRRN